MVRSAPNAATLRLMIAERTRRFLTRPAGGRVRSRMDVAHCSQRCTSLIGPGSSRGIGIPRSLHFARPADPTLSRQLLYLQAPTAGITHLSAGPTRPNRRAVVGRQHHGPDAPVHKVSPVQDVAVIRNQDRRTARLRRRQADHRSRTVTPTLNGVDSTHQGRRRHRTARQKQKRRGVTPPFRIAIGASGYHFTLEPRMKAWSCTLL